MTFNNLNTPRTLKMLTFLCPPLAVSVKEGKLKSLKVFVSFILTLLLWIPGVLYAYSHCFRSDKNTESIQGRNADPLPVSKPPSPSKLHNPTPIHPRANEIFSFPVTLSSVIIHIPLDSQEFDKSLFRNNFYRNHLQCMCLESNNMIGSFLNQVSTTIITFLRESSWGILPLTTNSIHTLMIRRYLACALIVAFFSYALYLIATDGGKELVSVQKLGENFSSRIENLIKK